MGIPEQISEMFQQLHEQNRVILVELRKKLAKDQQRFMIDRDLLEKIEFQITSLGLMVATAQMQITSVQKQFENVDLIPRAPYHQIEESGP